MHRKYGSENLKRRDYAEAPGVEVVMILECEDKCKGVPVFNRAPHNVGMSLA